MVKNRVLFCNNSLGGNAWRSLAPFYDVILSTDHVSLTLDGVASFLCVINVRNTCKRLRYSQTFGAISSVQWRKVGRIRRIRLLFHRLLCVRIEIDQLQCVNCWVIIHCLSVSCKQINHSRFALVIWSPLQLTSNSELLLNNSLLQLIYFLSNEVILLMKIGYLKKKMIYHKLYKMPNFVNLKNGGTWVSGWGLLIRE